MANTLMTTGRMDLRSQEASEAGEEKAVFGKRP